MSVIDLRSDTVTLPTEAMLRAMASAPLGDDVYAEDPTVCRLEERAAEMLGKEAAILLPSGTMANLATILAYCPRGRKVLVGDASDIWLWEAGGAAVLGGVVYHTVKTGPRGELSLAELDAAFEDPDDPQCALPGLICTENTHCMSGGYPLSREHLEELQAFARRRSLPLHMDGARLFNAAAATGEEPRGLAAFADSVSFCLSKGLAAPVGSMVVGTSDLVAEVRRLRKMLGGGMRQAGVLAAAGLVALEHSVPRLHEDHHTARRLARGIAGIEGLELLGADELPPTNIVFWTLPAGVSTEVFIEALEGRGVRVAQLGHGRIRAVTHHAITPRDIDTALASIAEVTRELDAKPVASPARG